MRKEWTTFVAVLASLAMMGGCYESKPEAKDDPIVDPGAGKQSASQEGAANFSALPKGAVQAKAQAGAADCANAQCGAGTLCLAGDCVDATPANKCKIAKDLGTLAAGSPITVSGTTEQASDVLSTRCAGGDAVEQVYKFEVAQDSSVRFDARWPAQFDAKVEFRSDNCARPGDQFACFDSNARVGLAAGTPHFLVIEQDVGRAGPFALELTATAEECPAGVETCTADALQVCLGGAHSTSHACAGGCATQTACAGAGFDHAIEVSESGSFAGDLEAYPTRFDAKDSSFCTYKGMNLPTPGPEVAFKLKSLSAGQRVTFKTGPNRAMFISPDAKIEPMPCADVLVSSGTTSSVDWVVPDGVNKQDFVVIIDKRTGTPGPFSYGIEINEP